MVLQPHGERASVRGSQASGEKDPELLQAGHGEGLDQGSDNKKAEKRPENTFLRLKAGIWCLTGSRDEEAIGNHADHGFMRC